MAAEGKIQADICRWLEQQGFFFYRQNNTPVFDQKLNNGYGGYRSQGRWSMPGLADIFILIEGKVTYIEVKGPRGKQSADQLLFARRCKKHGADYHVVRSVDEVKELFTPVHN